MVNPRAKIYLEWSTLKNHDVAESFKQNDVRYISGQDMVIPGEPSRHFGLYRADENSPINLAMPVWHWGKFYEQMIRNIMNGSWKYDDASDNTKGLNYWWGMSAGVIDMICSNNVPGGVRRLADHLKSDIRKGDIVPFYGEIYSQDKELRNKKDAAMKPEFLWEIFTKTGAPEAYLLYRGAQEAVCKVERP